MNEYERTISDIMINCSSHELGSVEEYFVSELPFCLRKMVWTRHFKMRIPANAKMALGSILHTHIKDILTRPEMAKYYKDAVLQFEVPVRTRLDGGIGITGHCDVLVSRKIATKDGEMLRPLLVEEWKFSRNAMRAGEELPIFYAAQVNTYATLFGAEKWRVNIVNPEDFAVTSIDGSANSETAKMMMARALAVAEIFRNADHPLRLLGSDYNGIIKRCGDKSNIRLLIDEVVDNLPKGPEYPFECETRTTKCPFHDICLGCR